MKSEKELREFIRTHEMRHYVLEGYSQVSIKKAYCVDIDGAGKHWVNFSYGSRPNLLTNTEVKTRLFKTMEEAKVCAERLRTNRKKKKEAEQKKADDYFKEVTDYLSNYRIWGYNGIMDGYGRDAEVKPKGKAFVDAIKRIYGDLPKKEKYETSQDCINLLVNYIRTGTFYSQGLSFRKEQVVFVKHGKEGAVEIELTNGMKIRPVSANFALLINAVFNSDDSWNYNFFYPQDEHNDIKEITR